MKFNVITLFILIYSNFLMGESYKDSYHTSVNINSNVESSNNIIKLLSPNLSSSLTFTLPSGYGTNGQVLGTLGNGTLAWVTASSSTSSSTLSGSSTLTIEGLNDGVVLYNQNGTIGGNTNFYWDYTNNRLGVLNNAPQYALDVLGYIRSGGDGQDGQIVIYNESGVTDYELILETNNSMTTTTTIRFPVDTGTGNQVLTTDGSGNLFWADAPTSTITEVEQSGTITSYYFCDNLSDQTINAGPGDVSIDDTANEYSSGTASFENTGTIITINADNTLMFTYKVTIRSNSASNTTYRFYVERRPTGGAWAEEPGMSSYGHVERSGSDEQYVTVVISGILDVITDDDFRLRYERVYGGQCVVVAGSTSVLITSLGASAYFSGGDFFISQYIYHENDVDTYYQFEDDRLRLFAGGFEMYDIREQAANSYIHFNRNNEIIDFIIDGDNTNNLFNVEAVTDQIGIATANQDHTLHVNGELGITEYMRHVDDTDTYLRFQGDNIDLFIGGTSAVEFTTGSTIFNEGAQTRNFRVESSGNANMFYIDGTNNRVGIGRTPGAFFFDVNGGARFNGNNADEDFSVGSQANDNLIYGDASATRVGINTAAPGTTLDVNGTLTANDSYFSEYIYHEGDTDTYFRFRNNRIGIFANNIDILDVNGSIDFNVGGADIDFNIEGTTDANTFYLDAGNNRIGIGTNTPNGKLDIRNGDLLFNENSQDFDVRFESNGNVNMFFLDGGNDRVGIGTNAPDQTLSVNGGASKTGGGSWSTFSDFRLKENINPLENALDKILKLNPVSYSWKSIYGIKSDYEYEYGFIAQEVEKIMPMMVTTQSKLFGDNLISDFKMLNTSALTPTIVKAIQEQQEIIEKQQKEIEELRNMIKDLKNKIENK